MPWPRRPSPPPDIYNLRAPKQRASGPSSAGSEGRGDPACTHTGAAWRREARGVRRQGSLSQLPSLGGKGALGLHRAMQHLAVLLGAGRFTLCTPLVFNFF